MVMAHELCKRKGTVLRQAGDELAADETLQ